MSRAALLAAAAGRRRGVPRRVGGASRPPRRARVADRLALALAPLARARREGRAPSGAERRRLALLAAGSLLAGGWLLGGPLLGRGGRAGRPRGGASRVVRARRGALPRGGPARRGGRRAGARGRDRRRATRSAARSPTIAPALAGRGRARAADRRARARARRADRGGARAACASRAGCRAWDTLVAAILLQRDAGGDLPALLRELAAALEAADRLERDARTATAQARFTAWLVVGLPVAAAALAELAAPGFLRALVAAPLPAALTALALLLQATGLVAIHRIVAALRPR